MGRFDDILERAFIADDPFDRFTRLKEELDERVSLLAALHQDGASGRKLVNQMTRLIDELLLALYKDAAPRYQDGSAMDTPGLALVAVGGYGRAELNPYSDVDLLFLYDPGAAELAKRISNEVLYPLWDLKLVVGHSVRTVADCIEMGQGDLSARTCMMESRLLAGDKALYAKYVDDFNAKVIKKDVFAFLFQKAEEQRMRHERFGSTVFLQQPNVKESPGALRDIHYLIWASIARYGTGDLKELAEQGVLTQADATVLLKAQGFFWRIRNDLHLNAGKSMDLLTFEEQLRTSQFMGFTDTRGSRGVERFMRRYYMHASRVLEICSRFKERSMSRTLSRALSNMIFARKVAPYFTLTNREVRVDEGKVEAFFGDGAGVLNLFHLAQAYGLRLHPETVEALSQSTPSGRALRTREAYAVFMRILGWDSGVAETLSRMHRMHILGRVLPEFARVDRLVTFSQYHHYTVDAHTLYAVQMAESLREADDIYGGVYRELRRKDILHLALLLHDAGKGGEKDHCEVGEELARNVAARMGFSADEMELLAFLVREHLSMTHIAFRRDLSDDKVMLDFARRMETPERLKMLFVLTHVDIRAVGPGTWNNWKDGLLTELYGRALDALAGRQWVKDKPERVRRVRETLVGSFAAEDQDWLAEVLDRLPGRYLLGNSTDEIRHHLELVKKLADRPVQVEIAPHDGGHAEIVVCAHDGMVPGLFSRIAGTLSAKDLVVLDAHITTFRDDIVMDVFRVKDPAATEFIDHHRWERIRTALIEVLEGRSEVEQLYTGTRREHEAIDFSHTEPLVRIDNETSDSFTVIDVFAANRQGLLYAITGAIAELGLSIFFSRIGTKADQVVDVFYVKNAAGTKVDDVDEITRVREHLMAVITPGDKVEV